MFLPKKLKPLIAELAKRKNTTTSEIVRKVMTHWVKAEIKKIQEDK